MAMDIGCEPIEIVKDNTEWDLSSKCHICLPDIFHFYFSIKEDIWPLSVFNFDTFFNEAIILLVCVAQLYVNWLADTWNSIWHFHPIGYNNIFNQVNRNFQLEIEQCWVFRNKLECGELCVLVYFFFYCWQRDSFNKCGGVVCAIHTHTRTVKVYIK